MSEITITSYFEDDNGPLTGLSPTIRIWEVGSSGNDLVIGSPCGSGSSSDGNMVGVGDCGSPSTQDGFYTFTFTSALGFDTTKNYALRIDGGVSLSQSIRYQSAVISPTDSTEGLADTVWNANASEYSLGSPTTMGGLINGTFTSVETIRVTDIPVLFAVMDLIRKYNTNRTKIDIFTQTLTIYDDDCVTPLRVFKLYDHTGTPSTEEVCERRGYSGSPLIGPDGYPTCE